MASSNEASSTNDIKKTKSESLQIDSIFKQIGEIGPYQYFIIGLAGICSFVPSIVGYSFSFIGATPDFRCKLPGYSNDTFEIQNEYHSQLVSKHIPPPGSNTFKNKYDTCHLRVLKPNETAFRINGNSTFDLIKCNEYVYSRDYFDENLVTEWNLVCDNESKVNLFSTLYFVGLYGVLLAGFVSDKIGRKKACIYFLIATAIFNAIICFLIAFDIFRLNIQQIMFAIVRLFAGVASNLYAISTVLAVEVCGPNKRVLASTIIYYFYIFSEFLVVFIAYFIRNRYLYFAYTSIVISLLFLIWLAPESPRWLLTKKRYLEASHVLKRIAKSNKKKIEDLIELEAMCENSRKNENMVWSNEEKDLVESNETNDSVQHDSIVGFVKQSKFFFKSRKFVINFGIILINWLTNTLVYYGLSFNTSELAGDPYLNFALAVLVELVGIIVSQYAFDKYGRKLPYAINMFMIGIALLIIQFVPTSLPQLITMLELVGKFCISITYNGIYIITSEMYPTVIRSSTFAVCQAFGRIGAIIAPSIQSMGKLYWYPIPYIVFGGFGILSAITFTLFISETKNKKLPDTMQEYFNDE